MKQILMILATVALVGCGKKETPEPQAKTPEPTKIAPAKLITNPHLEKKVRKEINKRTGELTKADLDKVTSLELGLLGLVTKPGTLVEVMMEVMKGLEKLTQLEDLDLSGNQLTDVKGLEKLTRLTELDLDGNPDLTKAQIDELKKALPKCKISSDHD